MKLESFTLVRSGGDLEAVGYKEGGGQARTNHKFPYSCPATREQATARTTSRCTTDGTNSSILFRVEFDSKGILVVKV